jgi:hypothetical protein
LNRLVGDGVLEKRRYEDHPPRHEYRLTQKGRDLLPVILTMMHWGDTYEHTGEPPVALTHNGHATHAVLTCAQCHDALTPFNVRVEPLPPVIDEVVQKRQAAAADATASTASGV